MNSCLGERWSIQILLGYKATLPQDMGLLQKLGGLNLSEADVIEPHSHVCLNASVLHFASLKNNNSKGLYYSVLANEVNSK
jgi:hypothetical protein